MVSDSVFGFIGYYEYNKITTNSYYDNQLKRVTILLTDYYDCHESDSRLDTIDLCT